VDSTLKLEESAFVIFKLNFEFDHAGVGRLVHWLQAGVVLPDEAL
jgi:hypothetical protein